MDETEALLEKAHRRLQAAQDLYRLSHFEDAVNRGYYSMVSAAMAALRFRDITTKTHKGLHHRFSEVFIKAGEIESGFGKRFRSAEDLRNKVDYDSFETISQEQAETVIDDARQFLEAVEELISSREE